MAVLDPATLSPMEIDYLIAQNITIEDDEEKSAEFQALMQIKVMLSTNSVLNRIIKSKKTNFDTLEATMQKIKSIMEAMSSQIALLPAYEDPIELMGRQVEVFQSLVASESILGVTLSISPLLSRIFQALVLS